MWWLIEVINRNLFWIGLIMLSPTLFQFGVIIKNHLYVRWLLFKEDRENAKLKKQD